MRIAFSPNLSLMRRAEFLPRSSQMRDLPAVRAAHLRTFRCCGMTDVEGGEQPEGIAALRAQHLSKAASHFGMRDCPSSNDFGRLMRTADASDRGAAHPEMLG